jgi:heme/copper-type cytochrome/quinol oxidase subunit 2
LDQYAHSTGAVNLVALLWVVFGMHVYSAYRGDEKSNDEKYDEDYRDHTEICQVALVNRLMRTGIGARVFQISISLLLVSEQEVRFDDLCCVGSTRHNQLTRTQESNQLWSGVRVGGTSITTLLQRFRVAAGTT